MQGLGSMQGQLGRPSNMQDIQAPQGTECERYLTEINNRIDELYKKLELVYVNVPQTENQKEPQTSPLIAALRIISEKLSILVSGIVI